MTETFFNEQMSRLVGLRFVPRDMTTHWEGLRELPEDVLVAAVSMAGRTRVDFPTPHELRQDADAGRTTTTLEEPDRTTALEQPYTVTIPDSNTSVIVDREWTYCCDECSDSGWRHWWCGPPPNLSPPWQLERSCDRNRDHAPHAWIGHCACSASNSALVRKRTNQAQYAVKRLEKGRH